MMILHWKHGLKGERQRERMCIFCGACMCLLLHECGCASTALWIGLSGLPLCGCFCVYVYVLRENEADGNRYSGSFIELIFPSLRLSLFNETFSLAPLTGLCICLYLVSTDLFYKDL